MRRVLDVTLRWVGRLAIAALVLAAPRELVAAPVSACPASAGADLGPRGAEVLVTAYLDPARVGALRTWLELRRLVAEYEGALRVEVRFTRGSGLVEPRHDRVRRWVVEAGMGGRFLAALRIVDRVGPDRTFTRITATPKSLAKAIGLDQAKRGHKGPDCAARLFDDAREQLSGLAELAAGASLRPPVFVVLGERVFEDGPQLGKLRPELATVRKRLRESKTRSRNLPRMELRALSAALARPPNDAGVLIGGPGLRHRLLLFAGDEDDPNLFLLLPPVLSYRSSHPGRLGVQIVARGDSLLAERLRRRLCAARAIGRELDYVRYLATEPGARRIPRAAETGLLQALDEVAEGERCADEPERFVPDPGLPNGPWLDGIARTRADLEKLDHSLGLVEASRSPLGTIFTPRAVPAP